MVKVASGVGALVVPLGGGGARPRGRRSRGPRSEGQVVVGVGVVGGCSGVANGAPVAHEGVAQGTGAQADGMGERDDGPLVAGSVEVVNEGHVLGHESTGGDVERMLEKDDGGELRVEHEIGHGRRSRCRGGLASAAARCFHDGGAAGAGALPARSAATCWR